jgi:hypothetical protein
MSVSIAEYLAFGAMANELCANVTPPASTRESVNDAGVKVLLIRARPVERRSLS